MAGAPDVSQFASLVDAADQMLPRYGERLIFRSETDNGRDDWSANEYLRRTRLAAFRMMQAGLKPADPVLLWAASTQQLVTVMVAAWRLGVVAVPLDLRFTPEVAHR